MSLAFWRSLGLVLLVSIALLTPIGFARFALFNQQTHEHQKNFLRKQLAPESANLLLDEAYSRNSEVADGVYVFSTPGELRSSSLQKVFPIKAGSVRWPSEVGKFEAFQFKKRGLHGEIHLVDQTHPTYVAIVYRRRPLLGYPFLRGGLLALLFSTCVSVAVLLTYLRLKGRHAEAVMQRLNDGDLSARLDLRGIEEFGLFGTKFNKMADTIELLIRRLRQADRSRTQIIEELAHDLRTPLTSILTVFEAIADSETSQLSPEFMRECAALAVPEIDYVNRLIYDLFLLAQVSEPGYKPKFAVFDLRSLIEEEFHHFERLVAVAGRTICFEHHLPQALTIPVTGDAHLMKRLLRNLLSNASGMAKGRVTVTLEKLEPTGFRLSVEDDGPGFNSESLQSFGETRPLLEGRSTKESSLRLGSVIMRTIVSLHHGRLETANVSASAEGATGARVVVTLPLKAA